MSSITTMATEEEEGRKESMALGTPRNPVPVSVLQEPDADRNGFAVLHMRFGRSGAPTP